ncbi:YsnF/AvaK domain-containing protein [Paracoccus shandongensis]|uniref:YsnF/AvaK domain-containing protein n=1 Tax=Paracoccus shandongensis TaxID=2816048 RepID=UPI001A8EC41F|nr:YsnF/AvaK domain-containing protein [Paracoccus shandongensis]
MSEDDETEFLPIIEETLSLTTRKVVTGRVRVATRTETVDQVLPAHLSSQEVEVVRVPVGRKVETAPQITTEGDLTIIPVVEERLVVTRELYLREEVHVRRVERTQTVEIPATTRRQTVQIDRLPPPGEAADPAPSQSKDDQDDL